MYRTVVGIAVTGDLLAVKRRQDLCHDQRNLEKIKKELWTTRQGLTEVSIEKKNQTTSLLSLHPSHGIRRRTRATMCTPNSRRSLTGAGHALGEQISRGQWPRHWAVQHVLQKQSHVPINQTMQATWLRTCAQSFLQDTAEMQKRRNRSTSKATTKQ